jgi:ribonuclease HI
MRLLASIDGGNDAGGAYIGAVVVDLDTGEVVFEKGLAIGPGTNNEAEYSALLLALYYASGAGADELRVRSDSRLVVNQMRGLWAVRSGHLAEYHAEARRVAATLPSFRIEWVPREENAEADLLTRVVR